MAEREQGEFELVLGNKQLFSVLFLVVILLGIFFAMGYLAGRSGPTLPGKDVAAKGAVPAPPIDNPLPARTDRPPAPARTETPPAEETKPVPKAAKPAEETTSAEPPDGKYLQAAALPKAPAQAMARLFARDGQQAVIVSAQTKNKNDEPMFRVLVGPFADNAEIAKARTYLKDKGIDKPIPRTYPDAR